MTVRSSHGVSKVLAFLSETKLNLSENEVYKVFEIILKNSLNYRCSTELFTNAIREALKRKIVITSLRVFLTMKVRTIIFMAIMTTCKIGFKLTLEWTDSNSSYNIRAATTAVLEDFSKDVTGNAVHVFIVG